MSRQFFSCLFLITMSGLMAFISRYVCIGISHKIVMLSFSVTVWGSCSYHFWFVFGLEPSSLKPLVGHLMVHIFKSPLLFLGIAHALVYLPIFVSIDLGHGALLSVYLFWHRHLELQSQVPVFH